MPTRQPRNVRTSRDVELFCLFGAGAIAAQLAVLGSLPFELLEPWDCLFHVLAYAALTLLLWVATDGRRPLLVIVGVMALGMLDEMRQAASPARSADIFDFLAGALAACATGGTLSRLTGANKSCAESSRQSPEGT
jgi:VanZ family protein